MEPQFETWLDLVSVELESVQTCCHVLQHLQQHVLSLINELGALHHQFPQTQVAVEHRADQPTFEMPLNGLHFHERREQSWGGTKHIQIILIFKALKLYLLLKVYL